MADLHTFSASDLALSPSRQELPPAKQTKTASRAHFLELPVEIILHVVDFIFYSDLESLRKGYNEPERCERGWYPDFDRFSIWRRAIRLAKTCRALNSIVTPAIYRADIKWNRGSSLLLGAKTGSASTIQKALEAGAEIDMWDFTELYDDFEELEYNMSSADVTREPVEIEMTALHWAAYHRHVDAISVLLEHGANIQTPGNLSCLHRSYMRFSTYPYFRVIAYIAPHFAGFRQFDRRTWLHYVLEGIADDEGPNVLYYALIEDLGYDPVVSRGQPRYTQEQRNRREESMIAAVKTLLQAGALMTTHSTILLHALHQACGNWDAEMVAFLLEQGANVHVRDILGNTPLHYVAMRKLYYREPPREVVRVLLRHGADINAVNRFGRTPLQVCFEYITETYREAYRPEKERTNSAPLVALLESEPRLFPGIMQLMLRDLDWYSEPYEKLLIREAIALAFGKTEPASKEKKSRNNQYKAEKEAQTVFIAIYDMLRNYVEDKTAFPESVQSLRRWSTDDWSLFWSKRPW